MPNRKIARTDYDYVSFVGDAAHFVMLLALILYIVGVATPAWIEHDIKNNGDHVIVGRGFFQTYEDDPNGLITLYTYAIKDQNGYKQDPFCGSNNATLQSSYLSRLGVTRSRDNNGRNWCRTRDAAAAIAIITVLAAAFALTLSFCLQRGCCSVLFFVIALCVAGFMGFLTSSIMGGYLEDEKKRISGVPDDERMYPGPQTLGVGYSFAIFMVGFACNVVASLLAMILAGPLATQLLGAYGADIIKIEPPAGDETRRWGPPFLPNGTASYFTAVNSNKRSLTLDLKQEREREALRKMVASSDVLLHNFTPATAKKLGVDYDTLGALNSRLIYCELTGYGSSGPLANRPGYDLIAASLSGLMHITGEPDGPPAKTGVAITDVVTGLYTHGAILAALYEREHSGLGQKIETSLLEAQLSVMANTGVNALQAQQPGRRHGSAHPSIVPYQSFPAKQGHISIAATSERQFQHLCQLLQCDHLAQDERFASNALRVQHRDALITKLTDTLAQRSACEWVSHFEQGEAKFAYGEILNVCEAYAQPQAQARDMVQSVSMADGHDISVPGLAVKFARTPATLHMGPPDLDQHRHSLIAEFELDIDP
ncbi:uncharacterized protein MONBRDRAFT_27495 [Monosiga brevicollis MX1]|uniref:Uncharacterized protein n=1 Tax=Monosiga brevicollis TaxID=81824 RepID=A9V5F7_MONBE|nr:uncharacterized protein MONBRDRAFT_27495 [Monosiga brevicollis MX1]EDQ87363.1 predicted protein [Monosiga brevicollis MX1]|eukprot:XP_001747976.1 hypothetical protein [Monosiga brevicollis MX1]